MEVESVVNELKQGFKTIFNYIKGMYYEIDFENNYQCKIYNDAIYSLSGYNADELNKGNYLLLEQIIIDEDKERVLKILKKTSQINDYIDLEYRIFHKDKKLIWISEKVKLVKSSKKKIIRIESFIRDITEQKKKKIDLNTQLEFFKNIVNKIEDATVIVGLDGKFKFISPQYKELLGRQHFDMEMSIFSHIHPDDILEIQRRFKKGAMNDAQKKYRNHELRLLKENKEYIWVSAKSKALLNEKDKFIGFIVSIKNITKKKEAELKLKKSEQNLKESEEKFRTIIENAKEGYYEVDLKGNFTFFNSALSNLLKYSPNELMGMNFKKIMNEENRKLTFKTFNNTYVTGLEQQEFQNDLITKNDEKIYVETSIYLRYGSDGRKIGFSGFIRDISERKKTEQKLKDSEENFRNIAENSLCGIFIVQDDVIKYANQRMSELNGYSLEEIMSWQPREHLKTISPESLDFLKKQSKQQNLGLSEVISQFPLQIIKKTGEKIWVENFTTSINYEGKPANYITFFDYTDKVKTEQNLKESEEKFRSLFESSPNTILILNMDGIIVGCHIVNNTFPGYEKSNLIGKKFSDKLFLPDEYIQIVSEDFKNVRYKGFTELREIQIYRGDKSLGYVLYQSSIVKLDSEQLIQVIIQDISKRKESEEKYRSLAENTFEGIAIHDKGVILEANSTFAEMFGYKPSEILGTHVLELTAEESKEIVMKKIIGEDENPYEAVGLKKDGSPFIIELRGKPIHYQGNKLRMTSMRDITYKKQAQQKLKESEEKYRTLFENSPFTIVILDMSGEILDVNSKNNQLGGYDKSELVGKKFSEISLLPKESFPIILKNFKSLVKNGYSEPTEVQFRDKEGNLIWYYLQSSTIKLQDRTLFQIISQNINERKLAEQTLIESEENFRTITEQSLMGIIIIQEGYVIYVNNAESNIMEYSVSEMLKWTQKDLLKHIHLDDRAKVINRNRKNLQGREVPFFFSYRIVTKSRKEKVVDVNTTIIEFNGKPATITYILDVSEKKEIEQKLKDSEEKYRIFVKNFQGIAYQSKGLKYSPNFFQGTVEEICGYIEKEFFDDPGLWISLVYFEDLPLLEEADKDLFINPNTPKILEYRIIHKDGTTHWVRDVINAVLDDLGEVRYVQGTVYDITEQKKLELQLKESEEKYRSLFENMNVGFAYHKIILDKNDKPIDYEFLEANVDFGTLTGLKVDDIIGKTVKKILPGIENDPADWIGKYGKVALSGIPMTFESYAEPLDQWYSVSAYSPIKNYFAVTFINITDHKKTEQKLKKSEKEISIILENIPELIAFQDLNHNIIRTNKAYADSIKRSAKDLVGHKCFNVRYGKELPCTNCPVNIAEKNKKPVIEEITNENGSIYNIGAYPVFNDLLQLTGFIEVIQDISEKKRNELMLLKSEKKFRKLVNISPNLIFLTDLKGLILECNKYAETILGIEKKELIGKSLFDYYNYDAFMKFFADQIEPGDRSELILPPHLLVNNNKREFWFRDYIALISFPDEKDAFIYIISQNVTDTIKVQNQQLTFLNTFTHSMINQLTAIEMCFIRANNFTNRWTKPSNEIKNTEIMDLSSTIDEGLRLFEELTIVAKKVLYLGYLESGTLKKEIEEIQISEIINKIIFSHQRRFYDKRLNIKSNIPDSFTMFSSETHLDLIFRNLTENAIKYTSTEGVYLEINYYLYDSKVQFSVKDHGIGIINEEMSKLFIKFSPINRSKRGYSSPRVGFGMGLYSVAGYVEDLGGKVWAESEGDKKGSTFFFELPILNAKKSRDPEISNKMFDLLGKEIFYKCIKYCLNKTPIYCITDNNFLKNNLSFFFNYIFDRHYSNTISIISSKDFDNKIKNELTCENYNFVFSGETFKTYGEPTLNLKKFNKKNYQLENLIIKQSQDKKKQLTSNNLKISIKELFSICDHVIAEIKKDSYKSENLFRKTLRSYDLKIDNELVYFIRKRYQVDLRKLYITDFIDNFSR